MSFDPKTALDQAIDAVTGKLGSIEGVANVIDHIPALNTEAQFKAAFVKDSLIQGWTVTRETTVPEDAGIAAYKDVHNVVIRGYYGLNEAAGTERTFQRLVEVIRSEFEKDRKLGGKIYYSRQMVVRNLVTGVFGPYLVHYCELLLPVEIYPLING